MNSLLIQQQIRNSAHPPAKTEVEKGIHRKNQADLDALIDKSRLPRGRLDIQRAETVKLPDNFCSYDYKLERLTQLLERALSLQLDATIINAIVNICRELNRMQGHYAPDKLLVAHAHLNPEQSQRIENLIRECAQEY